MTIARETMILAGLGGADSHEPSAFESGKASALFEKHVVALLSRHRAFALVEAYHEPDEAELEAMKARLYLKKGFSDHSSIQAHILREDYNDTDQDIRELTISEVDEDGNHRMLYQYSMAHDGISQINITDATEEFNRDTDSEPSSIRTAQLTSLIETARLLALVGDEDMRPFRP